MVVEYFGFQILQTDRIKSETGVSPGMPRPHVRVPAINQGHSCLLTQPPAAAQPGTQQ